MSSVLFVTFDGGGNVAPLLGIAVQLQGRGHPVRVLGHATQRATFESAGLRFEPYQDIRSWSSAERVGNVGWATKYLAMFTDRAIGKELLASVRREPVDLVVIDCLLFGALGAARSAGLPYACVVHTVNDWVTGPLTRSPIAVAARLKGIAPRPLWNAARRVLVAGLPDLDVRPLAANVVHTGPAWPRQSATGAAEKPVPHADGEPQILVSLSSIFYVGQAKVMQSIVDAVSGLPVHVVLTTGYGVDPAEIRAPANVELHAYVPHAQVMPKVSLVIGHGGHSTTMLALGHDLPLLIMPMSKLGDQVAVGRAVQRVGAGTMLARTARPAEIRSAVQHLLADGPHRTEAARLGARIRAADGAVTAADELEALLG